MSMYLCEIELQLVVDADNCDNARSLALVNAQDEIINTIHTDDISITKIVNISQIPVSWLDSIPWSNKTDDRTCEQRFSVLRCHKCGACHNLTMNTSSHEEMTDKKITCTSCIKKENERFLG